MNFEYVPFYFTVCLLNRLVEGERGLHTLTMDLSVSRAQVNSTGDQHSKQTHHHQTTSG